MDDARLFYSGDWVDGASIVELRDKFTGDAVAAVHEASHDQVAVALDSISRSSAEHGPTPYQRFEILSAASRLLQAHRSRAVAVVQLDTGFTVADAEREVDRTTQTLLLSAEEAKRIHGEVVPLDGAPALRGRYGFTLRRPLGVVCAITPFNSPLNTVAHKVAPALAAGNAVVVKPAFTTPMSTNLLVETLLSAGLPPELLAVVHGRGTTVGQYLLDSLVPAFYAFTGSTDVGRHLRTSVGLRRTQLELGSLSSTVLCHDASIDRAVPLCVNAAFRKAGQVCTSVQRLYVDERIVDDVADLLRSELAGRLAGDPQDPATFVGPVISPEDADRVESWIDDARMGGATVVAGGARDRQVIEPTVLAQTDMSMDVMRREVFGPVVCLRSFSDLEEAFSEINDTPFGLSAGIFTADVGRALRAAEALRMGSVHINETSSSRVDLQPYGGVKASGMGIEGPKYAIEEMTEQRLITLGPP